MKDIDKILDSFTGLKVMIIGDVMIDAYIWGGVDRISPEAPVPVVRINRRDFRLGGAANVALNIQSLGATPYLFTVVGDDEPGGRLRERLQEWEIPESGLHTSSTRPTTIKTRILSGHQHVVRVDEETDALLDEVEEKSLLTRISEHLPQMDVVIFEDYDKGVITPYLIDRTVELARQHNIPVVVDPKKRNFLNYRGVTLFKPNLKELREGLNLIFDKKDKEAVRAAVKTLMDELKCTMVMVTLSELGVYITDKEEDEFIPAHIREISDVSGAGDTVISVAALCIALKLNPTQVASLSNLAGGLVCEHLGVVPISREVFRAEAGKIQ